MPWRGGGAFATAPGVVACLARWCRFVNPPAELAQQHVVVAARHEGDQRRPLASLIERLELGAQAPVGSGLGENHVQCRGIFQTDLVRHCHHKRHGCTRRDHRHESAGHRDQQRDVAPVGGHDHPVRSDLGCQSGPRRRTSRLGRHALNERIEGVERIAIAPRIRVRPHAPRPSRRCKDDGCRHHHPHRHGPVVADRCGSASRESGRSEP